MNENCGCFNLDYGRPSSCRALADASRLRMSRAGYTRHRLQASKAPLTGNGRRELERAATTNDRERWIDAFIESRKSMQNRAKAVLAIRWGWTANGHNERRSRRSCEAGAIPCNR